MRLSVFALFGLFAIVGTPLDSHVSAQSKPSVPVYRPWQVAKQQPYTLTVGPVGTYQLLAATLDHTAVGTEKVVIRIDSRTGQAWRLVQFADADGTAVFSWMPISESDIAPN